MTTGRRQPITHNAAPIGTKPKELYGNTGTADTSHRESRHTGYSDTQDSQDSERNITRSPTGDVCCPDYSLPWKQYLKALCEWIYSQDTPEWQSGIFEFVRHIKGHPEVTGQAKEVVLRKVEATMDKRGETWTKYFNVETVSDARTEFLANWEKVRFLPGYTPLHNAYLRAKAMRLQSKRGQQWPDLYEHYDLFVSLAGWLQVSMGNRPILLPCHKLAPMFSVDPKTISRWRKFALEDGYLKIVKEARFSSKGGSEATAFRFDVSRWKCLSKAAESGSHAGFEYAEYLDETVPRPDQGHMPQ